MIALVNVRLTWGSVAEKPQKSARFAYSSEIRRCESPATTGLLANSLYLLTFWEAPFMFMIKFRVLRDRDTAVEQKIHEVKH